MSGNIKLKTIFIDQYNQSKADILVEINLEELYKMCLAYKKEPIIYKASDKYVFNQVLCFKSNNGAEFTHSIKNENCTINKGLLNER